MKQRLLNAGNVFTCAAALFICSATICVYAEPVKVDMKAGLWEHSFKLSGDSGKQLQADQAAQMKKVMEEMKQQFANLPPEQRKMAEEMMAQQGITLTGDGLDIKNGQVQISKDGTLAKSCITQAQINKGEMPSVDKNCTTTLTQLSKTKINSTSICTGDNPSTSVSEIVFQSPSSYSGTTKVTTTINGKQQTYEGEQSGKWLASDCGDIKPD